jgi:adenosylcobinamide-phosphate guanylyltransferase
MQKLMALVMAGGKGGRLEMKIEKPLIKIGGTPIIKKVIDACLGSNYIEKVFVAVSKNTPATERYLISLSLPKVAAIQTPGFGYHDDMKAAIRAIGSSSRFIVVAADIPSLTAEVIDKIALCFIESGKPALAVFAPKDLFESAGLKPTFAINVGGEDCVPCGINAVDGSRIDVEGYLEEEEMVLRDQRVCTNINTRTDLKAYRHGLVKNNGKKNKNCAII